MKKRYRSVLAFLLCTLLTGCAKSGSVVDVLYDNGYIHSKDKMKFINNSMPVSADTGYDTYVYESSEGSYYAFLVDRSRVSLDNYEINLYENVSLGEVLRKVQNKTVPYYTVIRTCDTSEKVLSVKKGLFSAKVEETTINE